VDFSPSGESLGGATMGDTANSSWTSRDLDAYIRRRQEARKKMVCSGCGESIAAHTKFLCVYLAPVGFTLVVGCEHYTPAPGWQYVFGGSECFHSWIQDFEDTLRTCNHNGEPT
jgi:hypothetical protein